VRLFPAIDIQQGRCVRLRRGDFADETVFGDDPVEMAREWERQGARFLHVVDLDGAREGAPRNFEVVARLAEAVSIPVELGGGIRSNADLMMVAESRVARVVIGTSAILDESLVLSGVVALGPRLVVAVDAEQGFVSTHGWQKRSKTPAIRLVRHLEELGIREVIYTDISRDGMMSGMNIESTEELARAAGVEIIASGGVTTLEDLKAVKKLEPLGVTGVIVGRALYEKRFTLQEALDVLGV